jgi:hypothetical protein
MKVSAETRTHEHYFQEIDASRLSDDKLDACKPLCPLRKLWHSSAIYGSKSPA